MIGFTKACFDTRWFGKLWFGWLWFGKLTNQTNQPHECGGMVKMLKVGGNASQKKIIPLCRRFSCAVALSRRLSKAKGISEEDQRRGPAKDLP